METSAPKRRKTSLSTAPPIESTTATTTATPPDPPPVADPPIRFEGRVHRAVRASYASPTTASLSKHNPAILQRRLTSPTKSQASEDNAQRDSRSRPQPETQSSPPERQSREHDERSASLRSAPGAKPLRSPTRQVGGGLAARPRRTPVKPTPRPLPPPGPDEDDEILNPFARRGLRRSPLAGFADPEPEKPELPPTPVHADNAASTPPTGIHSTPTRRPRRSRALAEMVRSSPSKLRSSPIKQPPGRTGANASHQAGEDILATTEFEPQIASKRTQHLSDVDTRSGKITSRPRPSGIRGVESADPDAGKKRQHDALRNEIAQLERDLKVVARENERIRQLQLSSKEVALPGDQADVLDVLQRHLGPRTKATSNSPADAWLQAATDPVAFLPFGKPSSTLPTLFADDTSTVEAEKEPISHHPISLSAREALPFLQAFTPLKFTSRITMLPQAAGDAQDDGTSALLQRHSITAISGSVPGLFTAQMNLTVDTKTHAVTSLVVPSIDPPCAAAELSPLIAQVIAEPEASCSALSRNVVVLASAMSSWLRIAVRRAKVWRTLDRELGTPDALERTVARVRETRAGRGSKRKAGGGREDGSDRGEGEDADSDGVADLIDSMVDTKELSPYMGLQWMDFPVPSGTGHPDVGTTPKANVPILRVQWRIEFDWTGEGTSKIRALVRLPPKWHHADNRTTLSNIPDLLDKLLRRGVGVVPAVETILVMLAGDDRQ